MSFTFSWGAIKDCFMRWVFNLIGLFYIIHIQADTWDSESSLWLVRQDVIKLGKRDVYESVQKSWNEDYQGFAADHFFSRLAIEDFEELIYTYLIPLGDYPFLGEWQQKESSFLSRRPDLAQQHKNAIRFHTDTLCMYLPQCSYVPPLRANFLDTSYLHYSIYHIAAEGDQAFEELLGQMVVDQKKRRAPCCWRVWKVVLGDDLPKYVVCLFAKTREDLERQISQVDFVSGGAKRLLRRQKQGKGVVRLDLSLIDNDR